MLMISVAEHQAAMVLMRREYNQQVEKLQVSCFNKGAGVHVIQHGLELW